MKQLVFWALSTLVAAFLVVSLAVRGVDWYRSRPRPATVLAWPTPAVENDFADAAAAAERALAGGEVDPELHVVARRELCAEWDCPDERRCIEDYLQLPTRAAAHRRPISDDELAAQIAAIKTKNVDYATAPLPPGELSRVIRAHLNIDFLLDGLDERPLEVTVVNENYLDEHDEFDLLLTDPYVGTFPALLFLPHGEPPYAAVVAVPGHGPNAETYRDIFGATVFPQSCLALLVLTPRGAGVDQWEDLATRTLLRNGFTFLGVRIYETLLALKYLRWRGDIAADRLGLIGQSGGSVVSNVTVRIEPRFRAYVSDCVGHYFSETEGRLLDETTPGLHPYYQFINDFSTSVTPVLTTPYEYAGAMPDITAFFQERLIRRPATAAPP